MISILIPTHNRCDILLRTLESLNQLEVPKGVEAEVLVVANACNDATVEVSERVLPNLPFPGRVVVEDTPGLNVARTRAVSESRGEICALLDDDVWLDRGWLRGLHDAFSQHPADVIGGRVDLWWEEVERPDWLPDSAMGILSSNQLGDAVVELKEPWGVIGANFAFTRRIFDLVGGFRPGLDRVGSGLMGGGESEFVLRVQLAGHRVFYMPEVKVKHWVSAERLSKKYLTGVAYGGGVSRVLMKPSFSYKKFIRSLVGHTWLLIHNNVKLPMAKIRKDQKAILTYQIGASVGRGGLAGLYKRFFTK